MPLISYEEALAAMRERVGPHGRVVFAATADALGRSVARPVLARERYPRFDSSAVDGYAFGAAIGRGEEYRCVGASEAGRAWERPIEPGTCVRILTGAVPPPNTFSVLMQEDALVTGEKVVVLEPSEAGAYIRRAGSDFEAGDVLLEEGARVNPGALALLSSQGIAGLDVFDAVRVSILTTGDEIVHPSQEPEPGQIRDSNGAMLSALILGASHSHVADDPVLLRECVAREAARSDVVILAGGASVGDRDYVPSVVGELGEIVFHGVRMRPGKPVLFGWIGHCAVFGLPGNPASAFVCFELFVREAIARVGGYLRAEPLWIELPFAGEHEPCGREDFVRVEIVDGEAWPVGEQASFGLRSLAAAQALARLPDRTVKRGELCQVLLLGLGRR